MTSQPVQGQLVSVEADPKRVKVDSEGTATATESKTRLLRPAIAALVAAKSLDNDAGNRLPPGRALPLTRRGDLSVDFRASLAGDGSRTRAASYWSSPRFLWIGVVSVFEHRCARKRCHI